jgi:hypothetical protein
MMGRGRSMALVPFASSGGRRSAIVPLPSIGVSGGAVR